MANRTYRERLLATGLDSLELYGALDMISFLLTSQNPINYTPVKMGI